MQGRDVTDADGTTFCGLEAHRARTIGRDAAIGGSMSEGHVARRETLSSAIELFDRSLVPNTRPDRVRDTEEHGDDTGERRRESWRLA